MDYPEEDEDRYGFGDQKLLKRKAVHDPDYDVVRDSDDDDTMHDILNDDDEEDGDAMLPSKRRRLQRLRNASLGLRRSSRHRSVQLPSDNEDEEQGSDHEEDYHAKRKSRFNFRRITSKSTGASQTQRVGADDEADELADDDGIFIVTSDIPSVDGRKRKFVNNRRRRPQVNQATKHGGDGIEFEAPRRSSRANKATKTMEDPGLEEDFITIDDEKLPSAPKVSGVREVFQPTIDGPFKEVHSKTCGTCHNSANALNKGIMIYCQGCSMAYHKICLGFRTTRDHIVTKIGPTQFVLQCRDCVGVKKKKDAQSPSLDICIVCKAEGVACKPFSSKRSAAAEQKLREENNGEDPVTQVDSSLIDNPDNVLFRCTTCHCAYHFEHLPPGHVKNKADGVRADRIAEYSIDWKCKDCLDMQHKISSIVTWRPANRSTYIAGQTLFEVPEDDKEYLIKWATRSYAHCEWKPGPWVHSVSTASMRNAFSKRNDGENLLPKFDAKDAIPEEYMVADVILDVRFKGKFKFESREDDLRKIYLVDQVLVKFQGLDYSEVVWDEPPVYKESPSRYTAFTTAYSEFLKGKHFKTDSFVNIKERLRKFRELDFADGIEFADGTHGSAKQPKGLTGTLMRYQIRGLNWLLHNFWKQRSCVLADEMGLGKTIQVISLISAITLQGPRVWPFLVVVPNSTCPNWRREIKQWAPDLRVVTYHGGREPQKLAYQYELFPNGSREMKAHVVVMSYDSAQDPETRSLFKHINWVGLIVDEGQRLKNDENLLYSALRAMRLPWRLLLTGTPLQNNKRELFNLLQFIDPSKNAGRLDEEYSELTAENIPRLQDMIRPYFLRRTKAGVLKFLPPMAQIILPVSMSVLQEKLSRSIMSKNPQLIRAIYAKSKLKSNERSSLNNILMQLRKCLGHPFIYSDAVEDKHVDAETMHRNLVSASSKLVLLEQMLPKLKEKGHRVLLFSQFLNMLDIIEDFLNGMGLKYQRLDGSLSSLEKQKRIDAYNEPNSEYFAFLLSTRAGGVGINLATADTVIILDPDFNPHQDLQALSRAHRIGQKNTVLCFQLMTKGTVEEKIMQIGRKKMSLDHALIETLDRSEDDAGEDLESILKHGAEALFGNNDREVIKYDSAAIDKLLDRSQIKKRDDDEDSIETSFAHARVWENSTGDLTDDIQVDENPDLDTGVWDTMLREREEEAKRLAEMDKEVLGRGGRRRQVRCHGVAEKLPVILLMNCPQTVKYTDKTNYGLDDTKPGENEFRGSDVDEEFIRGESSDETEDDDKVDSDLPSQGKKGMTPRKTAAKSLRSKTSSTSKTSKAINTSQSTPSRFQTPRKPRTPRTPRKPRKPRNGQKNRSEGSTANQMPNQLNALVVDQERVSSKTSMEVAKFTLKSSMEFPNNVQTLQ